MQQLTVRELIVELKDLEEQLAATAATQGSTLAEARRRVLLRRREIEIVAELRDRRTSVLTAPANPLERTIHD